MDTHNSIESVKFPSTLRVANIPAKHFLQVNLNAAGKRELIGLEGRFLDVVSQALHCSLELVAPEHSEIGRKEPGGNWTGIIGLVQRGKADLAMNFLAITEERLTAVDFSTTYTVDGTTFVIRRPGPLPQSLAYLYPFELRLWASFAFMMFLMPLLFLLLTNTKSSYFSLILQLFGTLVNQDSSIKDNSIRSKMLLMSWIVFSYVISLSYSAVLLSFLSVPLYRQPVRNFRELSNAVRKNELKAFVISGSIIEHFLQHSQQEHLRLLGDNIKEQRRYTLLDDLNELIANDRFAFLGPRVALKVLFGSDESKIISEDSLVSWNIALAVHKGFCCKTSLNVVISRMKSAGLFEKFVMDESYSTLLQSLAKLSHSGDTMQLSIKDIFGVIFLLILGYVLSFLTLLGEILYNWKCLSFNSASKY
ncbi:Glutamate receptor ionotropic, delta-2 [Araneus ventricosus]|uniref:Glutamate receptor ionotropic, delta-2 n=1 Tax=Araneus ventricosus TaxID=182803 RepID=A0A4Y2SV31_ARAVE|nr:Glutamate receptor ionotropic, delta-2 [Araneus ventricosus]